MPTVDGVDIKVTQGGSVLPVCEPVRNEVSCGALCFVEVEG